MAPSTSYRQAILTDYADSLSIVALAERATVRGERAYTELEVEEAYEAARKRRDLRLVSEAETRGLVTCSRFRDHPTAERASAVDIATVGADQHDGGRETVRAELSSSTSLAVRPWTTSAFSVLQIAAEQIADIAAFGVPATHEVTLEGRAWHVCEWIRPGLFHSDSEVSKCYKGYGGLLAVSWIVGAADLHAENIVVSKGMPWVVDAEFVFEPWDSSARLWNTGLLDPPRLPYGHGPLSNKGQPMRHKALSSDGSSLIRRYSEPVSAHLPVRDDGSHRLPLHYVDDIVEGFRAGLSLAASSTFRNAILAHARWSRRIVRPTAVYSALIEEVYRVGNVRSASFVSGLHRRLCALRGARYAQVPAVVHAEVKDLIRGDIPRFDSSCSKSSLRHHELGTINIPGMEAGCDLFTQRTAAVAHIAEDLEAELYQSLSSTSSNPI